MVYIDVCFDFGTQLIAVHHGHHQVGNDQCRQFFQDNIECLAAVIAGNDVEIAPQFRLQIVADFVIIFGNNNGLTLAIGQLFVE